MQEGQARSRTEGVLASAPERVEDLGLPYLDEEWEHGLKCPRCRHVFREGDRFTTVLYAFSDDVPMALVVCLDCGAGGAATGR